MVDAVKDLYNVLIDIGYTQNQIDEMDIVFHLQREARKIQKAKEENIPKPTSQKDSEALYIDQIGGGIF
ncbi:hypothetical protein CJ467_20880 [Bacillus velezensis]|nr:hypothetical protein CJ467_20880 [Bacillus velezensis]